jgi:DNA-directed RNA polymerase subunit RPC12/RpoP
VTSRSIRLILAAGLLTGLATGVTLAGVSYRFACRNADCGFKTTVYFGGGNGYELITGYCVHCEKFVYLKTKYADRQPEPIGTVLDPRNGAKLRLFTCPHCGKPFAEIASVEHLLCCPKCGGTQLQREWNSIYE